MKADLSYYLAVELSKDSSVLILSHFYKRTQSGGGPPQEIRDLFLPKVKNIYYVEHPFPYATDRRSSLTIYENGKNIKQYFTPNVKGPELLFYIMDPLFTLYFLALSKTRLDLCIALDNLNTVSVLPFKKVGLIKKIVFYTIDYNPKRFENKILNEIYHFLDRIACYWADAIWVLSKKMDSARIGNRVNSKKMAKSILLPMGANLKRIKILPVSKIKRNQMVYAGYLLEKQGVQLVLEAMPRVIAKIPNVMFVIIGQGEYEKKLKELARGLKISKHVKFKGFIKKHEDLEKELCESAIGIAPYVDDPDNFTRYTDPGKPKLYLGTGLPVVITDVPAIARIIQQKKAGFITKYDSEDLAKKIIKLLSDDSLYKRYRSNALILSKDYDTNTLITKALRET